MSRRRKKEEIPIVVAKERKETKYRVDEVTGKRIRVKDDGTDWAPPVRRPENAFMRWATGMLKDFYHIPEENIKVRQSPFGKTRTIYVLVNGGEKAVRNERELHEVVRELEANH